SPAVAIVTAPAAGSAAPSRYGSRQTGCTSASPDATSRASTPWSPRSPRRAAARSRSRRTLHASRTSSTSSARSKSGSGRATYSATKAAVNAFHESLRQEVRTQGVRVSVIEVDKVATGFGDRWPTALHDEAERAWRAAGFKFHGEPVSVADVADVVSFVVD